jgi:hypothetical protein
MHRGAHRVFGERGLERVFRFFELARDLGVRIDDAFGGELLQDPEAAAAGIDLKNAFAVDRGRVNDQVLQDAFGSDAGLEGGILGGPRWTSLICQV